MTAALVADLWRLVRCFGEWVERQPRGLMERLTQTMAARDRDTRIASVDALADQIAARCREGRDAELPGR